MTTRKRKAKVTISTDLIAPCGMNCRLCAGYIREKNRCPGCRIEDGQDSQKSKYRNTCSIKNCELIASGNIRYCSKRCDDFPCARLKQLDKRYRTKYGMSMLDNLQMIDEFGIRHFIRDQKKKWICPECGDLICVHKPACLSCGYTWNDS